MSVSALSAVPRTPFEAEELERRAANLDSLPFPLKGSDRYAVDFASVRALRAALGDASGLSPLEGIDFNASPTLVAGRVHAWRSFGKIVFASVWLQLPERSDLVQLALKDGITADFSELAKVDLGDVIGCEVRPFVTHKGEPSLLVSSWQLLAKSLRPWPEKWNGLEDVEAQFRRRYVDLTVNPETRDMFVKRSRLISAMRAHLAQNDFMEVETPVLNSEASGANARPFVTYQIAEDHDWYLRIAPETYLKRLVVGGFPRVFEFAKCFRNEGIDPTHLPEFTMLEYYASFWNYRDNMEFTVGMLKRVLKEVHPSGTFSYEGAEINFEGEWPERSFAQLFKDFHGVDIFENDELKPLSFFRELAQKLGVSIDASASVPTALDLIYKKTIRPELVQPQVITHYPAAAKPLAARNREMPWLSDSFQVLVAGMEIVNAFSELADPVTQAQALAEQQAAKEGGDDEAMGMDVSYVTALEHGMVPASGTGIGIDRLCMLLFGQSNLRSVILFPLMK